jgi:hypothetical protein
VCYKRCVGAEGIIEGRDSIGGEEKHAVVVLQQAQEDGRHGSALRVALRGPLLHVDGSLVKEQHRSPLRRDVENLDQVRLQFLRVYPELEHTNRPQRPVQLLR